MAPSKPAGAALGHLEVDADGLGVFPPPRASSQQGTMLRPLALRRQGAVPRPRALRQQGGPTRWPMGTLLGIPRRKSWNFWLDQANVTYMLLGGMNLLAIHSTITYMLLRGVKVLLY